MSAGQSDILIEAGADSRVEITLKTKTGTPIDITGWDFRCQIRNPITRALAAEAVIDNRTDAQGSVVLRFPPDQTQDLPSKEMAYDVLAIPAEAGSDPIRIIEGVAYVKSRVTAQ